MGERKTGLSLCIAAGLFFASTALWLGMQPKEHVPVGDPTPSPSDSTRKSSVPLRITLVHDPTCSAPSRNGQSCREESHWRIRLDGNEVIDLDTLRAGLLKATGQVGSEARPPVISEREVVIQGLAVAPWGYIQRFMNECAKVGLYKIEWSPLDPSPRGILLKAWLPQHRDGLDPGMVNLEEIRIFMAWDPSAEALLRKVGNRGLIDTDEEMMQAILQMYRDYTNAGKRPTVLIDATADVPWKDVIHVLELCRKANVVPIEFAAPLYEKIQPGNK